MKHTQATKAKIAASMRAYHKTCKGRCKKPVRKPVRTPARKPTRKPAPRKSPAAPRRAVLTQVARPTRTIGRTLTQGHQTYASVINSMVGGISDRAPGLAF